MHFNHNERSKIAMSDAGDFLSDLAVKWWYCKGEGFLACCSSDYRQKQK